MKYERTISTLTKAGFNVTREIRDSFQNPGTTYENGFTATLPSGVRVIEAYKQDDEVSTMRVRRITEQDDMMSDYSAGFFVNTVKQAVEWASRS